MLVDKLELASKLDPTADKESDSNSNSNSISVRFLLGCITSACHSQPTCSCLSFFAPRFTAAAGNSGPARRAVQLVVRDSTG